MYSCRFFTIVFTILILANAASAQTSWLDRPTRNWNTGSSVPTAPRSTDVNPITSTCRDTVRIPETITDRAVTRAGWSLFGAAQIYRTVTLVNGMTGTDGMCRPLQYNTFVFVGTRFAGTLAPDPMNSRTDGSLISAVLINGNEIRAEFARFTSRDALCCPSQTSYVKYNIAASAVQAQEVATALSCEKPGGPTADDSVVSGTVTYRQRSILPRDAVLTVRLFEIPPQNQPLKPVAEQKLELRGQQAPLAFSIKYDERDIGFRNDYGVEAEISGGGRVLFKSDASLRVLTKGNPAQVEIVVSPFVGSGQDSKGTLRGTVTYRERISLPNNSEIRVKLVDVSNGTGDGNVLAEDSFISNGRQVPLPFELLFDSRLINPRRNYAIRAEILTGGSIAFKTLSDIPVLNLGAPSANVEVVLSAAEETRAVVTGKDISLSKFGTGTFSLEGRSDLLLIRSSVRVQSDGKAEVSISPLGSGITFSGNLIYADDSTLRIAVTNSGNADASGEIEVKYSGQRLSSISSSNLMLDGQTASVRF